MNAWLLYAIGMLSTLLVLRTFYWRIVTEAARDNDVTPALVMLVAAFAWPALWIAFVLDASGFFFRD